MLKTIFFSDTHLSPAQPDKTRFLIEFLNTHSKDTSFYILGDLFDIWIGPGHVKLMDYADILNAFRKLTGSGTAINFIPGNRDYMVGQELAEATGVRVLPEVYALNLPGMKIMLTHGDLLCTDDIDYQSYRRLMQSKLVKSAARSLPTSVGTRLGKGLKNFSAGSDSARIIPGKTIARLLERSELQPTIPGSNSLRSNCRRIVPATVKRFLKESYDAVICGHIHKPSQTEFNVSNKVKHLFVVGSLNKDAGGNFSLPHALYQDGKIELIC
jgi:UDP-2,3-diacylglucosamine hydrolase